MKDSPQYNNHQQRSIELEELIREAILGDAEAQYKLGNRYFYGEGVDKNYAEALQWYRKAAEQGNLNAQMWLAFCHPRML